MCNEIYKNALQEERREYMQEDSLLGFRLIPDTKYCYLRDSPLPAEAFITNKQGFTSIGQSDFYYNRLKEKDVYRIIIIGGSTVWGVGTPSPEESLPARIQISLNKRYPNKKFEVINAGVGGYSTRNELLYLMSELVYYKPDLVISYGGWNDATFNGMMSRKNREDINGLKTPNHLDIDTHFKQDRDILKTFSLFLGNLNNVFHDNLSWSATHKIIDRNVNKRNLILRPIMYENSTNSERPLFDESSISLYESNLKMEIMVSKVFKFNIAIFLQPIMGVSNRILTQEELNYYKADEVGFPIKQEFYSRAGQVIKKLKNEYTLDGEVCAVNISKSLDEIKETVYNDVGHLYANGNEAVANQIIDELVICKIIRP